MISIDTIALSEIVLYKKQFKQRQCPHCGSVHTLDVVILNLNGKPRLSTLAYKALDTKPTNYDKSYMAGKYYQLLCSKCNWNTPIIHKSYCVQHGYLNYDPSGLSEYNNSKRIKPSKTCLALKNKTTTCNEPSIDKHLRCKIHYNDLEYKKFCMSHGIPYRKLEDLT